MAPYPIAEAREAGYIQTRRVTVISHTQNHCTGNYDRVGSFMMREALTGDIDIAYFTCWKRHGEEMLVDSKTMIAMNQGRESVGSVA